MKTSKKILMAMCSMYAVQPLDILRFIKKAVRSEEYTDREMDYLYIINDVLISVLSEGPERKVEEEEDE